LEKIKLGRASQLTLKAWGELAIAKEAAFS
jgi:hypothetical protein